MFFRRTFSLSARRCSQRSQQEVEAYKRKRRAEWKRKQGGQSFLDHVIVSVRGGKGGDGCAAFHREKFKPFGPPSGGSGGRGGSVYFLPTPTLTTLSTVSTRVRGHKGENGKGTWQNGKAGEPLVVKVPLGTIVRELGRDDPRRAKDEWESEEGALAAEGLSASEKMERMRERRWVHYPGFGESNAQREDFKEAEAAMYKSERERRIGRRRRLEESPIYLDLDKVENTASIDDDNAPLGVRQLEYLGHLIAKGGQGGLGNPHFVTSTNRSPRYATRGQEGERVTLSLELKLLADIGLVGMPNAGKSTLLRALTGGRAKTDVAGYAFTTLNPVVGIVRVASDGTFEGELVPDETVYDETKTEEEVFEEKLKKGDFAHSLTRNQHPSSLGEGDPSSSEMSTPIIEVHASATPIRPGYHFDLYESFRFTIADNPGLIENSASPSAHAGLGHSFLRAIERSLALVCVVDFAAGSPQIPTSNLDRSSQTQGAGIVNAIGEAESDLVREEIPPSVDVDPCEAIRILKNELETYQEGMSSRIKLVIANKADLIASPSSGSTSESVQQAKARLYELEEFARRELGEEVTVVPVSGKYRMNLRKIVALMKGFVEDARAESIQDVTRNLNSH